MKIEVVCPYCNSENISFYLWGYPSEKMIELEKEGGFILGGCVPGEFNWYCKDCKQCFKCKSKFPAAYCPRCNTFLAPEHLKLNENNKKFCLNCSKKVI